MGMFDDLIPGAADKAPPSFGMFADLVPPDQGGDTSRGFKVALGQTVPLAKGVVGLVGASAENVLGEGGLATAVKNWGLKGYQEGMEKLAPLQKDTDELTTAWDKAKDGDLGALVDWVQYGLGYAAGQGGEAILASLIGGAAGTLVGGGAASPVTGPAGAITGLVAKGAVKEAAQGLIQKAVIKEANALMVAGSLTADEAVKQATKSVVKNIGSSAALLAYGTGQELGSIYPEAEAEADRKGRTLTGFDLARVWGSGLAAGGIEALTDKLGIDVAMGRLKVPGAGTRLGSAALTGGAAALTEGATEGVQTAIEHYGAGQPIADEAGIKDIINSAGLGMVGGAGIGGGAGLLHGGRHADPAALARSNQAMDDIANAPDADAAIDAFARTHIPITVPATFDAEGAMARMERANANDEAGLRDRTNRHPEVADAYAAAAAPTVSPTEPSAAAPTPPATPAKPDLAGYFPTAPERIQAGVPETFQDRLAVVREKLQDSRTRQQLRDNMGSQALGDALYFAKSADDANLPGQTSDSMLRHAERLLSDAGVPDLPRQVAADAKVVSLVEKRAAAQAKLDEESKTKEKVAPAKTTQELAAAAAAPGAGLAERVVAAKERQKAALLTGNKPVAEEGLLEPLPSVIDERAHEAHSSPSNDKTATKEQILANNAELGHDNNETFPGLNLSIENPEGSTRVDLKHEPPQWSTKMAHHYGYIKGTQSIDGEHMDVFVKPGTPKGHTGTVFVVDQIVPKTGAPDEHKVMLGFDSLEEAKAAYHANYSKDWKGLRTISAVPFGEFKQWLATGDTSKPFHTPTFAERVQAAKERVQTAPEAKPAEAEAVTNKVAGDATSQAVSTVTTPQEGVDLGPTVKHTTGKGKDIFGYVLHDATDKEARAIDPYTFNKDGGKFIREKHGDALTAFIAQRGGKNAPQEVSKQGGVQQERGSGDEGRQAAEAGGGDRVQREAQGTGAEAKPDGQGATDESVAAFEAEGFKAVGNGFTKGIGTDGTVVVERLDSNGDKFRITRREGGKGGYSTNVETLQEAISTARDYEAKIKEKQKGAPANAGDEQVEASKQRDNASRDSTSGPPVAEAGAPPKNSVNTDGMSVGQTPTAPPNYGHLIGKFIEQKVKVADTRETATLRMDAAAAMRDLDERERALEDLRNCIRKAA